MAAVAQINPLDLIPSSKRKTSKLTRKHNRLPGDTFAGYYKAPLVSDESDADFEYIKAHAEMTGDWKLHLPKIMGVKGRKAKTHRFRMNFYLVDIAGNRYEPIQRELQKDHMTIREMCMGIDKMRDEIVTEQSYLIDLYKSYVVVRA